MRIGEWNIKKGICSGTGIASQNIHKIAKP